MERSNVLDHNASAPSRGYDARNLTAPDSVRQHAVLILDCPAAWELGQPEAVFPSEELPTLGIAGTAGFRCFTESNAVKRYVRREVLAGSPDPTGTNDVLSTESTT